MIVETRKVHFSYVLLLPFAWWCRQCEWELTVDIRLTDRSEQTGVGRVRDSEPLTHPFWQLPSTLPKSPDLFSYIEIFGNKSKIPECSMSPVKHMILFTNPSARAGYDTRSISKRSLTGLNSEFSFSYPSCLTKAEEPSLSYYLPIAGGRIIGFIPFPRVLVLCEMQSVLSRIWTRVAVFISYGNNDYITGTSVKHMIVHLWLF